MVEHCCYIAKVRVQFPVEVPAVYKHNGNATISKIVDAGSISAGLTSFITAERALICASAVVMFTITCDVVGVRVKQTEMKMNAARRKELAKIAGRIEELKGLAESIKSDLEDIKSEEEEYLDNMSENLKGGEKASNAENEISLMEDALAALEEVTSIDYAGAEN